MATRSEREEIFNKLINDEVRLTQNSLVFGPLRVFRVPEIPSDDFGRVGDIAIIDDTAVESEEIAIDQIPTDVAVCQKVPAQKPEGPVTGTASTLRFLVTLPATFSITNDGVTTSVAISGVFPGDVADDVNAASITNISASFTSSSLGGSATNSHVFAGEELSIDDGTGPVTVTFPAFGRMAKAVNFINAAALTNIKATLNPGGTISLVHSKGGPITIADVTGTPSRIFGVTTLSGGAFSITDSSGLGFTTANVVGDFLGDSGFPAAVAAAPLVDSGTWKCFLTGVEAQDEGTTVGDFTCFNFTGAGVTVTESTTDPNCADVTIPGITGGTLTITTINGQPMLTLEDTTRSDKILSVGEQPLVFSNNILIAGSWMDVGNAVDADSGYIADFDGTVVYVTAHCEDTGGASKDIHLFINGVDQGSLGILSGGANATFSDATLDFDFDQGDKIRLQAQQGSGGAIQDTVVKLTVKWRG